MGIPLNIMVAQTMPARTPARGASNNYYNVMSKSLCVSHEAGNKEGIVDKLQESIVNDMDFCLHSITGNICPGLDLFLETLGNSAFMVRVEDIPDSVCEVFIAQACSADHAIEDFCKEMEEGQKLTDRLHSNMNETVGSLLEDTDNLQDDMAKVVALAGTHKVTAAKMLQSMTSLAATAAALVTVVNDLIPVVWCQGALLQDMQSDHVKFWQDTLPLLTSMVCWCNTMLKELQRDQVKLGRPSATYTTT
jgi:hypothetical protein